MPWIDPLASAQFEVAAALDDVENDDERKEPGSDEVPRARGLLHFILPRRL